MLNKKLENNKSQVSFLVLVLILVFTLNAMSASYVSGDASYKMQKNDSLGFAKRKLHYLSYRDVLTKELSRLSLDPGNFWIRYDNGFKKNFEEHETHYKKAISLAKGSEQKSKVLAGYREFKLKKQINFAGLSHIVISESIKKFGHKLGHNDIKTMKLDAKLNYKALRRLYSRFMIDSLQTKKFDEVVLKIKFDWGNIRFDKLGSKSKEQIEQHVMTGWKEWFLQNQSDEGDRRAVFIENEAPSNTGATRASLFINVRARKEVEGATFPIRYQMSLALKDDEIDNFIFFNDIPNLQKVYATGADESKRFTNDVWAIPIPYFMTIRSLLDKSVKTGKIASIELKNYRNIVDVLNIQDKMKTLGISINLFSSLDSFDSSSTKLILRHNGNDKELAAVIKKIQQTFFPIEMSLNGTSFSSNKQSDLSSQFQ